MKTIKINGKIYFTDGIKIQHKNYVGTPYFIWVDQLSEELKKQISKLF